ncbi:MAG TPA: SDR family oxidoreductase [Opitutaceae bacterium]|jgi:NAD(P)-dependent dehydrogenase (short-subunit alcohol dehydrogenase family)|nr:SDR family oxidoreductase [Opitutaceae bacterium]
MTAFAPRLASKHALVTGAGSGIGRALVERFAAEGASVTVLDYGREAAEAVASAIREQGGRAEAAACDVSDAEAVRAVFAALPRLDILVNNAGIAHIGTATSTQPADFDRVYAVNVKGVYHCLHFGLPRLLEQKGGVVLNVASIASKVGLPDRFAYSMTKGAVLSMTLSVARDYVAQGIRCNCICPARVHTPFVDGFLARTYPGREAEMFAKLAAAQPVGRMGEPAEIAALAAFLCSPEASFITGSAYDIDGGTTLLR